MHHRVEIDGLRAVAVLPVVFFHAGYAGFSGGFVGVDVFFVISGYLITGILMKDLSEGRFSIMRFYERRARRLLPALFVVLAVSIPFAVVLMMPAELLDFSQSVLAASVFLSNIFFVSEQAEYFRPEAELTPLLHTWSLAVEEQFYIVFPILLAVLWRFGRRFLVWTLIALALVSLLAAEWGARNWIVPNFYLAHSRVWELLAGALCALLLNGRKPWSSETGALLGLAMILLPVFLYDDTVPFPGFAALLPVLGTVLVILCADEQTRAARILSFRPLVLIGLISYSAYLWHQPVFAFGRLHVGQAPSALFMPGLIVLSLLMAYGSWRFVEQPFRHRQGAPPLLPRRRGVFAASLAGLAFFATLGTYGHLREGLPNRFDPPDFVADGLFELPHVGNGYCFYSIFHVPELEVGENTFDCRLGETTAPRQTALLLGDSFAAHWEPFWDVAGRAEGIEIHAVTSNWCGPTLDPAAFPRDATGTDYHDQCRTHRAFLAEHMADYDLIVLAGEWDLIEDYGYLEQVFDLFDHILAETGAEIILMPVPMKFTPHSVSRAIYFSDGGLLRVDEAREAQLAGIHARLERRAAGSARVHYMDRRTIFGDDPVLTDAGMPYSLDGGHISIYGSLSAAESFLNRDTHVLETGS